ncbi:MAG: lamin tail domain-containing protein [Flavobacteriales bacterium]|nr:lamin tail domain-containing protein [Flavobacteriales bacterium]
MTHRLTASLALASLIMLPAAAFSQDLRINEVDCDSNSVPDSLEFVELHGAPEMSLDSYTLVFFKGSTDIAYEAFDLTGQTTSATGFFVIGNPDVDGVNITFEPGVLRDGGDAVALLIGSSEDWPYGTSLDNVTEDNLVDAVVYGTNDQTDPQLIAALTPDQPQLNEWELGIALGGALAWARVPDGGTAFDSESMMLQQPTPGESNVLTCDGGWVVAQGGLSTAEVCVDLPGGYLPFEVTTSAIESNYGIVIADAQGNVIDVVTMPGYDFAGSPQGPCWAWGISYEGDLDPTSIIMGQHMDSISAEGCLAFSVQSVEINRIYCLPPSCDGGWIYTASGANSTIGCLGFPNTHVDFGYTTESPQAQRLYMITSEDGSIIDTTSTPEYDFQPLGAGDYDVYALSFLGDALAATLSAGQPVLSASSDSCASISANHLNVAISDCDPTGLCTDLFFSEYVDGSSFNKGLEIYNPSVSQAADLGEYLVETYNNGSSTANHTLQLSGTLQPSEVFTIVNGGATVALSSLADVFDDVTLYNGNDVTLLKRNGTIVDALGNYGEDPGSDGWPVNDVTMLHHSMKRNSDVTSGSDDWAVNVTQWATFPENTFTYFGDHEATVCGLDSGQTPEIGFPVESVLAFEGDVVGLNVPIVLPIHAVSATVEVLPGGTATAVEDFGTLFPLTLSFPDGALADAPLSVNIVDDFEPEGLEEFQLLLTVVESPAQGFGPAVVWLDTVTIQIAPSDLGYPHYPIADVRGVNILGGLDSLLVPCELRGVIHGFNTYPSGLQFTIIDPTAGIQVFSAVDNFNYLVAEGDSIRIRGSIAQFMGTAQILVDTLILSTEGEALYDPELVNTLDEYSESRLVRLKCAELVDASQWTNATPLFDVQITTGIDTFLMVIDADTDLFGSPAPYGVFGVTGIGGQRDEQTPWIEDYTILPRSLEDLSTPVDADFDVTTPWDSVIGPLEFTNTSAGAGGYYWVLGDGTTSDEENPSHVYDGDSTYIITLTAFSLDGICSDQSSVEVYIQGDTTTDGVGELTAASPVISLEVYPNPTTGWLQISTHQPGLDLSAFDVNGRLIWRGTVSAGRTQLDVSDWPRGSISLMWRDEQGGTGLIKVLHL